VPWQRRQLSAAAQKALFLSLALHAARAGWRTFSFIYAGAHYLCVSLLINKDTALNENLFQK
jgi:hypothetical protein